MTFRVLGDGLPVNQVGGLEFYPQSQGVAIPLTIQGLQLWLKADAGTFQDSGKTTPAASDGDVVGAWADQSGQGNDVTQGTTANKPLLKLNILNGRSVIRGDGANDRLINSTFSLAQPSTTFITYKDSGLLADGYVATDSYDDIASAIFRNLGAVNFQVNAGATLDTPRNSNFNIHAVEFNGFSGVYYTNGTSRDTGNIGANGYSGLSVMNSRGNPNPVSATHSLDGDIAEIIIYNSILSTANRQSIESYLNGRYAIF